MRKLLRCVLLGLLVLPGCASFKNQPFNAGANQSLKTIGLLPFGQQEKPNIVLANLAGENFGLVGALVSEGQRKIATVRFQRMAEAQDFHPVPETRAAVRHALEAAGYRVVDVSAARADDAHFLKAYPAGDGQVDAYLDIYAETVGYLSASSRTFRPTVYLSAKLVQANGGQILFADQVQVNAYGQTTGVTIEAPEGYAYDTQSALLADASHAVEGIRKAITLAADGLSERLAK